MAVNLSDDIPPWKKHLIARLRDRENQCTSNGNSAVTVSSRRQLSPPSQSRPSSAGRTPRPNKQTSAGIRTSSSSTCNQFSATSSAAKSATKPSFPDKDGTSVLSEKKFVSPHRRLRTTKMVQERAWTVDYTSCESVDMVSEKDYSKTSDSDSSEELHYGPGIVNKLKNKYLSLTLRRENYTKSRPSLLNFRKATSLENILDEDDIEDDDTEQHHAFQVNKNSSNRYRNSKRGAQDMKRARSVEVISRFENMISPPPQVENTRPKSLHEYILINDSEEGNDKPYRKFKDSKVVEIENNIENALFSNNYVPRLNRPKRIAPVMNEREKPPVDVVKQAKMIFEKRPEQRTKPPVNTGEVAAKVACYKTIIGQSKPVKKPVIKVKPSAAFLPHKNGDSKVTTNNKKTETEKKMRPENKTKVESVKNVISASETPKITPRSRGTKNIGEKLTSPPKATTDSKDGIEIVKEVMKECTDNVPQLSSLIPDVSAIGVSKSDNDVNVRLCETPDLIITTSSIVASTPCDKTETENALQNGSTSERKTDELSESAAPNYCDLNREHLPVNKTSSNEKVPINEPLKLIINGNQCHNSLSPEDSPRITQISPIPPLTRRKIVSPPIRPHKDIDRVVEKNLINAAKSLEQSRAIASVESEIKSEYLVPKKVKRPPREPESNSIVFKFTDRKDVPDYVQNDRSRAAVPLEKPKVGEGGIILLPGASLDESFTDEDEEIRRFLQAPPSPCDVTFINDNILIDGKSSLSQKTKKSRLRISFIDSGPDVYEYPSESSLLIDEASSPTATTPLAGHTVPTLSGSYLANYIPKSTEEFQPGVTRSVMNVPPPPPPKAEHLSEDEEQPCTEEVDQPIMFSAGTNPDILF